MMRYDAWRGTRCRSREALLRLRYAQIETPYFVRDDVKVGISQGTYLSWDCLGRWACKVAVRKAHF
jgi:hypothetical protein